MPLKKGNLNVTPFYVQEFTGTRESLSRAIEEALQSLTDHDWAPPEKEFCARLCLEEALVNAIVHGNKNDPARKVKLEISEEGDTCHICIFDEGEGFEPGVMQVPECHQLGGRGVPLMKYFMDRVTYNKQRGCLEMVIRRKGTGHGDA